VNDDVKLIIFLEISTAHVLIINSDNNNSLLTRATIIISISISDRTNLKNIINIIAVNNLSSSSVSMTSTTTSMQLLKETPTSF